MTVPGRNADVGSPPVSDPSTAPTCACQPDTDAVAALVRSWAAGWALSRGFTAPEPTGTGLWIRPGEPGRERELVWPLADEDIEADLLATIGASPTPTWVTVATQDVSQTQGELSERGVVPAGWPEWLMSKDLADGRAVGTCPESFTCTRAGRPAASPRHRHDGRRGGGLLGADGGHRRRNGRGRPHRHRGGASAGAASAGTSWAG